MVTIVDYGLGNITSVQKAFESLGAPCQVSSDLAVIESAQILVVPGQGACGQAMGQLSEHGLIQPILNHINANKPFLGICLGFQILFESSEEDGGIDTLGVFPGTVKRFQLDGLKVPHMGWNQIQVTDTNADIFRYVSSGDHTYFVHSFYVPETDSTAVATTTDYGVTFVSSVRKGNCFGTQFHPEKSGDIGLNILKGFLESVS